MNRFTYPRPRPDLVIECTGGVQLGNCYSSNCHRVTSAHRLTKAQLEGLNKLRLLGFGQEFNIKSKCDGTEEPVGYDEVACVVTDDSGRVLPDVPAINPYSGEPYGSHRYPFFVYEIEARCDSGD